MGNVKLLSSVVEGSVKESMQHLTRRPNTITTWHGFTEQLTKCSWILMRFIVLRQQVGEFIRIQIFRNKIPNVPLKLSCSFTSFLGRCALKF